MATQQTKKPATGTDVATSKQRLPFPKAFGEEFGALGVSQSSWRTLIDAVWPEAKTIEAVSMALGYCKARKLDPFKRPVHIVPVWDSRQGRMVETVWPGMSELRTTAMRTGAYAGKDETVFGPMVKEKVGSLELTYPEWAQVTVYRMVQGQRVAFTGSKVYWLEAYAKKGGKTNDQSPNAMWSKRTIGQLDKCAEAMALRQAFPEELGSEYAAEEMHGQMINMDAPGVAQPKERRTYEIGVGFKDDDAEEDEKPLKGEIVDPDPESEDPDGYLADDAFVAEQEAAIDGLLPPEQPEYLDKVIGELDAISCRHPEGDGVGDRARVLIDIHDAGMEQLNGKG